MSATKSRLAAGLALAVLILAPFTPAARADGASAQAEDKKLLAGFALLDRFVDSFQQMALTGAGGLAAVEDRLRAMMTDARQAKDAGTVTLAFFARYNRLLAVTKLIVAPDPGGILVPVIDRTIADFVRVTTGETMPERGGPQAVGAVANAIAEEIVNLQIYLETFDQREAIRQRLDKLMSGPGKSRPDAPADRPLTGQSAASPDRLRLHEELMLIALRDLEGTLASKAAARTAIGGAILAELLLEKRIEVEAVGKELYAKLLDPTPLGESLIDEALAKVAEATRRAKVRTWVERFAGLKDLERRAAERLVSRGILRIEGRRGLFGGTSYPQVDPNPEREVIRRVEAAIFSDDAALEARTVMLISLAKGADLLRLVLDKPRLEARKARLERIVNGELAGRATREAVQAMQAANIAAHVASSFIVTTSGKR